MNPSKKENIKVEDGKLIINDESVIKKLEDQGMQFSDDGSLELEEGQNLTFSVTVK